MEEGQNIFDATEYIMLALNSITNFEEFIEYKKEIEKAVNDIRNSLLNLKNNNKTNKIPKNKSKINSILVPNNTYNSYFNNKITNLKSEKILHHSTNEDKKENNIIFNKSIRNNFKSHSNNKTKITKSLSETKSNKYNKIANIIMKLNSEDYYYIILSQLFGNDLKDKLIANEVSDELLTAVTNSIHEIESLKKKDDLKNIKNLEEMEEEPRQFPVNEVLGPNPKFFNFNKIKKEEKGNVYQEFDFVKNLRQNKNTKTMKEKKEKPFISTTSIYGNYFDPPLQKGGISKLDDYKKEK